MNLLIIDTDGCGLDMAYRAAADGHAVRWWMPPEKGKVSRDGYGFPGIARVTGWKDNMEWAKKGLIVNLFNGPITKSLDEYRDFGFPIFGPSWKSAQIEINRAKGMKLFEKYGLPMPKYDTFNSLQEARKFALQQDDRMVFKTLGSEEDKSLSYVGCNPADMVARIDRWIKQGMTLKGPCMLQEVIEGIEVGVSGWMSTKGFLQGKWNINYEHKKLMPGNYGPNTGEMGTVTSYCEKSKLAEDSLMLMEKDLIALGHIGDIDINFIVNAKGAYPLEFTARFGWPSTQILFATHEGDSIQWMKDCLSGKDTLKTNVNEVTATGIVMAAPPYPHEDKEGKADGLLVSGIEDVFDRIAPWQLEITKGPVHKNGKIVDDMVYKTTGPYVCVALGIGHEPHDSIPIAYEVADQVEFPNRILRNDIGKKLEEQIPKLRSWGYDDGPDW